MKLVLLKILKHEGHLEWHSLYVAFDYDASRLLDMLHVAAKKGSAIPSTNHSLSAPPTTAR